MLSVSQQPPNPDAEPKVKKLSKKSAGRDRSAVGSYEACDIHDSDMCVLPPAESDYVPYGNGQAHSQMSS